ncbi:MAG: hypothetical protein GYA55_12800 [SAR324 cluster bacterium]|uniref:Uncharacterized protein n=1 Tax=SAR324 cluster bacterium TaxID=2024889 RepID=A0A7X9ILC9_9DELT|nr:hypothetical protein [SAR324 cluster bacterium]
MASKEENNSKLNGAAAFPSELLQSYSESLTKLLGSPHYSMFENLRFSELLGSNESTKQKFNSMSLSELVSFGLDGLMEIDDLCLEDIQALLDMLNRFNSFKNTPECSFDECTLTQKDTPALPAQNSLTKEERDPGLNAIERSNAELELAEKKQRLKRVSSDLLSSKLLSDYWEKDWERAPFEEALSFKQLSDLDFETLIKKRSFNVSRMISIGKAIDKFMAEHDLRLKQSCFDTSRLSPESLRLSSTPLVHFETGGVELPLITQNLVRYFEHQCALYPLSNGPFKVFFAHLPLTLKADEVALLALSVNNAPSFSRRLLGLSKEEFDSRLKNAQLKTRQLFERTCPKVFSAWSASLASVGISEESFLGPYFDSVFDESFQLILFRTLLLSLGAAHPTLGSEHFVEIWTSNLEISDLLFASLKNSTRDEVLNQDKFSRLFPGFPIDKLKRAFKDCHQEGVKK